MKQTTRNKFTYVSFILACMIIWHHTYNVNVYNLTGFFSYLERFLLIIQDTSVPLFFIMSAFLFYYNLDNNNLISKLKHAKISQ